MMFYKVQAAITSLCLQPKALTWFTSYLTGPKSGLLSWKSDCILIDVLREGEAKGSMRAMDGIFLVILDSEVRNARRGEGGTFDAL
jgi:hypothetical protein